MLLSYTTLSETNNGCLGFTNEVNQLDPSKTILVIPIGCPIQTDMPMDDHMYNGLAGHFSGYLNKFDPIPGDHIHGTCVILPLVTDHKMLDEICRAWIKDGFLKIAIINFNMQTNGSIEQTLQSLGAFEDHSELKIINCIHKIRFIDAQIFDDTINQLYKGNWSNALQGIWLSIIMYKTLNDYNEEYRNSSNCRNGSLMKGALSSTLRFEIKELFRKD